MRDEYREKRLEKVLRLIETLGIQEPLVIFLQKSRGTWDNYRLIAAYWEDVENLTVSVLGTCEHIIADKPDLPAIGSWVEHMGMLTAYALAARTSNEIALNLVTGEQIVYLVRRRIFSLPSSSMSWMGPPEPVAPAGFVEEYDILREIS